MDPAVTGSFLALLVLAVIALGIGLGVSELKRRRLRRDLARAHKRSARGSEALAQRDRDLQELLDSYHSLREQEEHQRSLINALPGPVWCRNSSLKLTYVNQGYCEAVGFSRQTILDEGMELIDGAGQANAIDLARHALESGSRQHEQLHAVMQGERRLLEIHEQPLPDGTLLGFVRDLTEMEEVQADFERQLRSEKSVLEKLSVGVAIYDTSMRLAFHNTAYAQLRGLDETFLNSRPHLSDLLERLRELRRLPEQADFAAYRQQTVRRLEHLIEPQEELIYLPDNTTLRLTMSPHPSGGMITTCEDVTDSLRLERRYNTLLEVHRTTLDNLFEGIAVFGADGQLKLFNPAYARIWKLSEDYLDTGPHIREIIQQSRDLYQVSDEMWPDFREAAIAVITDPEPSSGRENRADSTLVDWTILPLPDGACLATFVDVTDSSRVERALRERNDALETADRLKSEFLANISYELRTPLNAIVGFAEILKNEYFGKLNDRQTDYAHAIAEASDRLMNLINNILDLASIEAGYLQLDLEENDPSEILESTGQLWQERARSRELRLNVDCPEGLPPLNCDHRRITQALFNLLSNAVKYTPEGGLIELKAEEKDNDLLISVSDTGIGIALDEQHRVFNKFERTGASGKGPGLGLSLVRSLIELHGGDVSLRSSLNHGTTVTCRIPRT